MEIEKWKSVPGYNSSYFVSNWGNVKSTNRIVEDNTGIRVRIFKGRMLKPTVSPGGYRQVVLSKDNKRKAFTVSQLVAKCFLGYKIEGKKEVVDHIDGDKLNDRLDNLQIISARENISKGVKNKTSKYIGVSWDKNKKKWVSSIRINGKCKWLGVFEIESQAAEVYQKELKTLKK